MYSLIHHRVGTNRLRPHLQYQLTEVQPNPPKVLWDQTCLVLKLLPFLRKGLMSSTVLHLTKWEHVGEWIWCGNRKKRKLKEFSRAGVVTPGQGAARQVGMTVVGLVWAAYSWSSLCAMSTDLVCMADFQGRSEGWGLIRQNWDGYLKAKPEVSYSVGAGLSQHHPPTCQTITAGYSLGLKQKVINQNIDTKYYNFQDYRTAQALHIYSKQSCRKMDWWNFWGLWDFSIINSCDLIPVYSISSRYVYVWDCPLLEELCSAFLFLPFCLPQPCAAWSTGDYAVQYNTVWAWCLTQGARAKGF